MITPPQSVLSSDKAISTDFRRWLGNKNSLSRIRYNFGTFFSRARCEEQRVGSGFDYSLMDFSRVVLRHSRGWPGLTDNNIVCESRQSLRAPSQKYKPLGGHGHRLLPIRLYASVYKTKCISSVRYSNSVVLWYMDDHQTGRSAESAAN